MKATISRHCATCIYRDECASVCLGYAEDSEAASERAAYEEMVADIGRDEDGEEEDYESNETKGEHQ